MILGKPIPKARPRHARRGKYVVTYDPQKDDKEAVKAKMLHFLVGALNSQDKQIVMEASELSRGRAFAFSSKFYLPVPDKATATQKNRMLWGIELPNVKPDFDNLEKFYLDCANEILFPDDRLIVEAQSFKYYSENPSVELIINTKRGLKLNPDDERIILQFSPNELKEFLNATKLFNELDPAVLDKIEGDSLKPWLSRAASLLLEFSEKYAEKLRKIKSKAALHAKEKKKQLAV